MVYDCPQKAFDQIREAGTMEYLVTKWKGDSIPQNSGEDLMILSAGQTLLIFIIMCGAFALAGIVFCMEVVDFKMKHLKFSSKKRKKRRKRKKKNQDQVMDWIQVKMNDIERF